MFRCCNSLSDREFSENLNLPSIINWYPQYESQNWYPTAFLVNTPAEISRADGGDREWNNVTESGCHLTCIAMMLGLNPAYWAALLCRSEIDGECAKGKQIFRRDPNLPATDLSGNSTNLVWDQNAPAYRGNRGLIHIECLWHPHYRAHYELKLRLRRTEEATSVSDAEQLIAMAKDEG